MASKFTDLLLRLGEDPQLLEAFKKNPNVVMDAAGLTPAEKALLFSGDAQLIRSAIVADPDHKEAFGIPHEQSLPTRIPLIVYP
jgi:hypothetical protein